MSSLNKIVFRIIGLFALIASITFLASNVSQLNKLTTIESFFYRVIDLTINCIGIYGGFKLVQLRKVGSQLLIIWLLCRIFTVVLVILMLVTNLFFAGNNQFIVPIPILLPLTMGYYIFSPVVLVYLLVSKTSNRLFVDDNPRHTLIVARLLSLLTPGLGRAVISNPIIGMILFYVYSGVMLYAQFDGTAKLNLGNFDFTAPQSLFNFFDKVIVWAVFARLDWEVVKNHEKSQHERLNSIASLDSSQVNGG